MKFTQVYYTVMDRLRKQWCTKYSLSERTKQENQIEFLKTSINIRNALHKYRALVEAHCPDFTDFQKSLENEYAPVKEDRRKTRKYYFQFLDELSRYPIDPRSKLILFLGGRCCKCNDDNLEYLEIDHIKGDGWEDRVYFKKNQINIWNYYLIFLEEAAEKLQLLCVECHRIKTKESGDAWHRRPEDTKLEVAQN
jgi:5-methylcytosine-specific restriction endonuclease McrA